MCCFSKPVSFVTSTKIFARDAAPGRQFLVYKMTYQAREDLAMVLPIPVREGAAEDAVRFIDLERYADFFTDLRFGFPGDREIFHPGSWNMRSAGPKPAPLPVVAVGSFDASFVPSVKDFSRLDPRFRMPPGVWARLPGYAKYGFAVFKLKKSASSVHPMAFDFPRAGERLFFPTIHIHDGKVHATARFAHRLYCQVGNQHHRTGDWIESPGIASSFMKLPASGGLIDGDSHCYMKILDGNFTNADIWV